MVQDLTNSRSNTQNNRVGKNGPKYNLAFSIWEQILDSVTFCCSFNPNGTLDDIAFFYEYPKRDTI